MIAGSVWNGMRVETNSMPLGLLCRLSWRPSASRRASPLFDKRKLIPGLEV